MKRFIPYLALVVALLWLGSALRPGPDAKSAFDLEGFGRLPVLVGGRLKPLDTVARNSLMIIHGKQTLRLQDGRLGPMQWLAQLFFQPKQADTHPLFRIVNPEVLGLFGWQQGEEKDFSFDQLSPFLEKIDAEGLKAAALESGERSPYQTGVLNLRNALLLYQQLKNSLRPEGADRFADELRAFYDVVPKAFAAADAQQAGQTFDSEALQAMGRFVQRYQILASMGYVRAVPPGDPAAGPAGWTSAGESLLDSLASRQPNTIVEAYARLGDAYAADNAPVFNQHLRDLTAWLGQHQARTAHRADFEAWLNRLAPFYLAMGLYVLVFLLACSAWLGWNRPLLRGAFWILLLALAVHTFGLGARMYLQERPPVTNLYSSAIFIGWGTVIIGLILERIYRDGLGAACASAIGFVTLIIAHHLAGSGDTLEMLRAVLDTNIWLATHVVVITLGYSAMFLAGMLALLYVLRGVFTRSLEKPTADSLTRMVYGVVCFATLFSFVGTVLGGIWADQSWGRFWGWDPKENGALLIVLWCAFTLHARWGGYIRARGLMACAIFGNVVTAFSWFGVNMLGVGLHSYGFMDKAFPWLIGFSISQVVLALLAGLPLQKWRSPLVKLVAPARAPDRSRIELAEQA